MRDLSFRYFASAIALCAGIAVPAGVGAHQGQVIFPMFELPSSELPDLHDGTLDDWEAVLPDASIDHNDFIWQANRVSSIEVEDMAFRVFLAWHNPSQMIYIGYEGIDDEYQRDSEDGPGNGYVTLLVDGDHSAGQYQFFTEDGYTEEESRRQFGSQAQGYTLRPQVRDNRHLFLSSWASWAQDPPWADIGAFELGESPTLSVMEVALTPWDDLHPDGPELSRHSVLEPGAVIGLNVSVVDFDLEFPRAPDGFYYLADITLTAQVADGSFSHRGFSPATPSMSSWCPATAATAAWRRGPRCSGARGGG